jgi:hypothetical protein
MSKKIISVIVLIVGIALIVAPFAYKMFDRASAGADMMKAFEPVLTQPTVDTFKGHMVTIKAMQADMGKMIPAFAQKLNVTADQLNQSLAQDFPGVAAGLQKMDTMVKDLDSVITVMDQNVTNFAKADKLPMRNMPWFFIIPGAVLVILAVLQLAIRDKKKAAAA